MSDLYFTEPDPLELEIEKVLREMQERQDIAILKRFKSELKEVIPTFPNVYIIEIDAILRAELLKRQIDRYNS